MTTNILVFYVQYISVFILCYFVSCAEIFFKDLFIYVFFLIIFFHVSIRVYILYLFCYCEFYTFILQGENDLLFDLLFNVMTTNILVFYVQYISVFILCYFVSCASVQYLLFLMHFLLIHLKIEVILM
jgi:hypothetical protein